MDSEDQVIEPGEEAQHEEATSVAEAVKEPQAESAKEAEPETEEDKEARPSDIESLKPGMRLTGTVRNVVDFGAFVDVGVGRDGLAHISTLKRAGIDKSIQVGDELDVQIRRVDLDRNRISLTIPGAGRSNRRPLRDLDVGDVVEGRVVRLVDFGAFIDIGAQTDGLLHISEMQDGYVNSPAEVVNVGDEVEVRILDVDTDRRRISLSMKGMDVPTTRAPIPEEAAADDEDFPTAFQVAWESAMKERRQRDRGSR